MNANEERANLIRVLHVEDSLLDAHLMKQILADRNADRAALARYALVQAGRVGDAVKLLSESRFDVILLDLTLPDAHGLDTLRRIQRAAPRLPVVVLSGSDDDAIAIQAVQEGAQDYLVKGRVDGYSLTRALHYAIERMRAEEAQKQSAAKMHDLLESISDAFFSLDDNLVVTYINAAAERILNRKRAEVVGRYLFDAFPEARGSIFDEKYRQAVKDKVFINFETFFEIEPYRNWYDVRVYPQANGISVYFQDIGARKRYEHERETSIKLLRLINSNNDLKGLMETVSAFLRDLTDCEAIGIRLRDGEDFPYFESRGFPRRFVQMENQLCVSDLKGQLLRDEIGNPVLECMCGNILCGRFDPSKPFFTPHGSFWSNGTTELLASTTEADRQARTRNRCNGEGYESVALLPLRAGDTTFGLVQLNDHRKGRFTTESLAFLERLCDSVAIGLEHRYAEHALRESEARYHGLVDQSPDAIIVHRDGRFAFVNPAGATLLGAKDPQELVGEPILRIVPHDQRGDGRLQGQPIEQGRPVSLRDEQFVRLDGTTFDAEVTAITTTYEDKPASQITLRDITERKRAEAEIQRRAEQMGLLYDAGLTLNRILDPTAQIEFLLKIAKQSLHADCAEFFQWDDKTRQMVLLTARGVPQGVLDQLRDLFLSPRAENNLVAWVAEHRVPLYLPEVSRDPRYIPCDPEMRSGLWVPVQREEKLLGVMAMLSARPQAFAAQDEQLLMLFANQAAVALENARLFAAEQARRKELTSLYDLSRALADNMDLDVILSQTVSHAVAIIPTTFVRVLLIEDAELTVRAALAVRFLNDDLQVERRVPLANLPFCRRALAQGTSAIGRADSEALDELEREFLFAGSAQLICLIPLRAGQQEFGFLQLGEARQKDRESFTAEKLHLASSIGDQLAGALHRATLHAQTRHRIEQLSALREIDQAITSSLDLRVTLDIFLEQVVAQLRVDAADVLLLNRYTHVLEFAAARGFRSRAIKNMTVPLGKGHAGCAALERRMIIVPDHHEQDPDERLAPLKSEQFVAHCSVPLIVKGEVKGVLDIYHRAPIHDSAEWREFLELLAGQAAIAIDNAALFDNLQRSNLELASAYDATIEGWSRALDLRDKETEGHTQRVVELTLQLAQRLGFSDRDLAHLRRGVLLHDIGKVGIPDHILLKAGPLTDEEWTIMRQHPQHAYELLLSISYLKPALDIPYCHHEKWDGTGYPRGLKGENIPLAARIFAVVDVWDALRSDRPYREAWPETKVRAHLKESSAKHFDPKVVEAFLNLLDILFPESESGIDAKSRTTGYPSRVFKI